MARRNSNLKWEVVAWANSPASGSESLIVTIGPLVDSSQGQITVIDSSALESHDREQLTLIRLVGCIRMATRTVAGAAGTAAAVKVRLHKGIDVNFDGGAVISYADPWDPIDAEEEFLWERTYDVVGESPSTDIVDWNSTRTSAFSAPPYWTEIDIPLKRTIRPPEILGLTFAAKGFDSDSLAVWAWLRALIAT